MSWLNTSFQLQSWIRELDRRRDKVSGFIGVHKRGNSNRKSWSVVYDRNNIASPGLKPFRLNVTRSFKSKVIAAQAHDQLEILVLGRWELHTCSFTLGYLSTLVLQRSLQTPSMDDEWNLKSCLTAWTSNVSCQTFEAVGPGFLCSFSA